jgi:hypothetical protein
MGYVCLFSRLKQEENSLVYSVLVILIATAEYREFPIKSLSGERVCVRTFFIFCLQVGSLLFAVFLLRAPLAAAQEK